VDTFGLAEKGAPNAKTSPFLPSRVPAKDYRAGSLRCRLDELAREFSLAPQTVRNWCKRHELDAGVRSDGLTSEERAEFAKLKRENTRLTIENDILSKAAAWFARETSSIPDKHSNS
jgi:transposase